MGEGSDSPTARACKTGMQKLRGLFIKGSKGRLRGDGNDEEAMAGKRGTLEYNEEEEAMEEISIICSSYEFPICRRSIAAAPSPLVAGGAQPLRRRRAACSAARSRWRATRASSTTRPPSGW